jgi:DNA-binding beta-propeller fold protein YncE
MFRPRRRARQRTLVFVVLGSIVLCVCTRAAGDGSLYVASGFTDEVLQLDAVTGSLQDRLPFDLRRAETDEPHALGLSPDRRFLYVTVAHGDPTLWKVALPTNQVVGRARLGIAGAGRVGITPDGGLAFVPDYYRSGGAARSEVAVVRLHDLAVVDRRTVCVAPHDAQVSPDGTTVAIACSKSDELVLLDVETREERGRFPVGDAVGTPGNPAYQPLNLVWSPGGDRLYVTLHRTGVVAIFASDGTRIGGLSVGEGPAQLALTADGRTLVVANRRDTSVSLVDVPAEVERARVPIGGEHPHGVALSGDNRLAFVTFEGSTRSPGGVVAIDLADASLQWQTEAGAYTLGIVYVPAAPTR